MGFLLLWRRETVASVLVPVFVPVCVGDETHPPGVVTVEFDDVFRRPSGRGVVFKVPPVIQ